jgi:hypothetical protein
VVAPGPLVRQVHPFLAFTSRRHDRAVSVDARGLRQIAAASNLLQKSLKRMSYWI